MKFKKEYLILSVVIIGASLYLYLKDKDRVNYRLPEPAPIGKNEIAKIDISRQKAEAVTLGKVDGVWQIIPQGYKVDDAQVNKMLTALSDVTLTALVSNSKDYDRYGLTDDKAIRVSARSSDDKVLRELTVGKRAASGNHTFVRIGSDPSVYHAGGSLRKIFDKASDDVRDKLVLSFDKEDITDISIVSAGETLQLKKQAITPAPEEKAEAPGEGKATEKKPEEKKDVWKTTDGQEANQTVLDTLLIQLSSLKCSGYLPEGAENGLKEPAYMITLTGKQTCSLSLYAPAEKDKGDYAGISSENKSAFKIHTYEAEQIMKKPDELLAEATKK